MKIDIEQDTADWHNLRLVSIGASDIPVIAGVSEYMTPYKLWQIKTGFCTQDAPNPAMLKGKDYEPMIRQRASEELGLAFLPEVHLNPDHMFALASLDGIAYEDGKPHLLECKYNSESKHKAAKEGAPVFAHVLQMQWQMFCAEANLCYYASYHDKTDDLVIALVGRSDDLIKQIFKKAQDFVRRIEEMDPPEKKDKDLKEEFITINEPEAVEIAEKLAEAIRDEAIAKENYYEFLERRKKLEERLVQHSDDGNFVCGPVKLTRVSRQGQVDWKALCADKKITDEETNKYRKQEIGYWKSTLLN